MDERTDAIGRFLAANGWGGAKRATLAADASFRRYDRIVDGARTAVLMDAPPPKESVQPFVTVANHLAAMGFGAPKVLAEDRERGFLLLEDLGDDTFTKVLAAGGDERALYALAVDVLIDLHRRRNAVAIPGGLPDYDHPRLLDEAILLFDWFLPAARGGYTTVAEKRDFVAAWMGAALPGLSALPPILVLRDFHVDNLMVRKDRTGLARCGLLDFQDALIGPRAYDLMSLLEDARRDVDPALAADMTDRYLAAFPDLDRQAFMDDFTILAAQRHAKVIGIFTRLCVRDGKGGYLRHIPRVWRLLERTLTHPALASFAAWLDEVCPKELRKAPDVAASPAKARTGS